MKFDFLIAQFALFANILVFAIASNPSSESSVDGKIQPGCLECPSTANVHKRCTKKDILYLRDRTCYTCPKYKCVNKKYFKEGSGKICPKIMPICSGRCKQDQTCLVTVQTRYSCSKAKCIKRLLNRNRLEDHFISEKK